MAVLILLTQICGASLIVSAAVFPLIKAQGSLSTMFAGYAAVALASMAALVLLRLSRTGPRSLLFGGAWRVPAPAVIVAIALSLRIAALVIVPVEPTGDPANHELAAWNVAQGLGYVRANGPDAHWPPGYVLFASVFYLLLGRDWHILAVVNCLLDACTVLLVYRIAQSIMRPAEARVAALLYALNPTMIIVSQTIIYAPLLSFTLCLLVSLKKHPAVTGFLIGLTSLIKPVAVPLLVILAVDRIFTKARWKVIASACGIAFLLASATIAPWTVRNYLTFDRFVPVSANAGWVLWWGNNDRSDGLMQDWSEEQKRASGAELIDLDRRLMRDAITWIIQNPAKFLSLVPLKQANTWGTEAATLPDLRMLGTLGEQTVRGVVQVYYICLILLSGGAMIRHARFLFSHANGRWMCLIILLVWVIHSVYIGWSFYRIFLLPFLSVIAVIGLVREARERESA